jgi:hypothetical protein
MMEVAASDSSNAMVSWTEASSFQTASKTPLDASKEPID